MKQTSLVSKSIDDELKLKAKKAKANLASVKSKVNSNMKTARPATERKSKINNNPKTAGSK